MIEHDNMIAQRVMEEFKLNAAVEKVKSRASMNKIANLKPQTPKVDLTIINPKFYKEETDKLSPPVN